MRHLSLVIFFASSLALSAAARAEPARLVTGFSNPESVLLLGARRFVSNIGAKLDPLTKDGDGFISELDADGRVLALKAFPGEGETLDAPKGMAVIGSTLYVADVDRVVGFDIASRRKVFEALAKDDTPILLNDLAAQGETLLVTDTLRGLLLRLDPKTGAFSTLAANLPGANGVVWDAPRKRILVAALGAKFDGGYVYEADEAGAARRLPDVPLGIYDGLAVLPDGRALVSDWVALSPPTPGALRWFDPKGGAPRPLDLGRSLVGPADFALDADKGELWLPLIPEGAILVAPVPK
jgi:hypothetical protein